MNTHKFTIIGMLGAFAILSLGSRTAIAQDFKKSNIYYYNTSKGNRLALAAAKAMASEDCKSKIGISAKKPNKNGGWVSFNCESPEWSVIIHFKRIPGGRLLLPDRFRYAG